jgi:hypothetical protein
MADTRLKIMLPKMHALAGVKLAAVRIYFEGLGFGVGMNEDVKLTSNVGPSQ